MIETPTIETLLNRWIEAFNSHDLDRHMDLYTEDATLFGSIDELQVGRDAVRRYFGRVGSTVRVAAYPMPHVRVIANDVAVTAGHVDFADGDKPVPYRMTWVLVRREGSWKISQHHGSPRRGE